MTGFGASCPLPSVPTKVRLLNPLPTLDLGDGNYSSCPLGDLRDLDHATVGGASENEGSICLILTTSMLCYRKIVDGSQ